MERKYINYDKFPELKIEGYENESASGYPDILAAIGKKIKQKNGKCVVVLDCYSEVYENEIVSAFKSLNPTLSVDVQECLISDSEFTEFAKPYLTDDRVFGIMNTKKVSDIFVNEKLAAVREKIEKANGIVLVYGVAAGFITNGDILIHCSVSRWEIQCRFAKGMPNWKTDNAKANKLTKYKQGFFLVWRMLDRHKRSLMEKYDYYIDTNVPNKPNMISGNGYRKGLESFAMQPFRLVPYFAPEVWGGQWMKEVCGLDKSAPNYAWAFDGVPEENSIFMKFGNVRVEVPSVEVVFFKPNTLLGDRVHARFGDEFPIRFDFLDTMGGQNLSFQVHPLTEYIQQTFGMHYTQDESYYILDCDEDSDVYLGFKKNVNKEQVLSELDRANKGEIVFDADKYVNTFKAKKHDHFLIPAGTVHCSGKDTMVLEISATPYIFTFKLWDWSRLGLDGLPRPVHIKHGEKVIQWDRDTEWVEKNCINAFSPIESNADYSCERTGLHKREFIDTIRYNINTEVKIDAQDSVSMCNLVDGESIEVISPSNKFAPFTVHYAETFIVPASVGSYILRATSKNCKVLRAFVR